MNMLTQWHPIAGDVLPEPFQDVWFVVDGNVFAGFYWDEGHIFGLADGRGFKVERVSHWMATDCCREVAGYPKYLQRVAIELPNQPCLLTATFNNHYLDNTTGNECIVAELDPIYKIADNTVLTAAAKWEKVFAWMPVPEPPMITQMTFNTPEVVVVETEELENPDVSDFNTPLEDVEVVEETAEPEQENPPEQPSSAIKASRVQEAREDADLGDLRKSLIGSHLVEVVRVVKDLKEKFPSASKAYQNVNPEYFSAATNIIKESDEIEAAFDEICDDFIDKLTDLYKTTR